MNKCMTALCSNEIPAERGPLRNICDDCQRRRQEVCAGGKRGNTKLCWLADGHMHRVGDPCCWCGAYHTIAGVVA